MKPTDAEDLLWELAGVTESSHRERARVAASQDAMLEDYREGRLDENQALNVEEWLGADDDARLRMVDRSVRSQPTPPPAIRAHVLAAFEREYRPAAAAPRRPAARRARLWASGWAAAAAAVLLGLWLTPRVPPASDVQYEVEIRGLAERRGAPVVSDVVRARPDTIVRIEAFPQGLASSEVEVGLYRDANGRSERVQTDNGVRIEWDRGTALFEARAADLVGSSPGIHDVYVIVGPRGALPAAIETPPAGGPGGVDRDGRYRVYRRRIEIVSEDGGEEGVR